MSLPIRANSRVQMKNKQQTYPLRNLSPDHAATANSQRPPTSAAPTARMPCPLRLPEKPRGMRKRCLSFAGLPKRALTPHARGSEILQWAQGSHGGEAQREVILGTRSERKRRRKPCPRQRKRKALYSTPALHRGKAKKGPEHGASGQAAAAACSSLGSKASHQLSPGLSHPRDSRKTKPPEGAGSTEL